ncbi:MAG: hypothetical protein LBJ72_12935, partial [Dysgonamonadaceae bacterium]|nr:hypothetical protein [Dysgonamonadaceae bacterium]
MIKIVKIFLALSLLFALGFRPGVQAQTIYPVQVNTQLIPPYTPFTPGYYSGGKEKLKVTLINTDLKQPV